jgi:cytochrome P450
MRQGLLIAEGLRWKVQRKIVQKLFGKGNLRGMEKIIVAKSDQVSPLRNVAHIFNIAN